MNITAKSFRPLGRVILTLVILLLTLISPQVWAMGNENPDRFSREELAQLLAPIALYPDSLLSQILMASTYPIEVVEADRWIVAHPLTGVALDDALLDEDWDPSVKALCHFPSILALMSERLGETTDLGNAFLDQEEEVMAMVQDLRATAYARGKLASTDQQKVIVEKETIIIEPAQPHIVYVPYYDPYFVYGPWGYPAYPPYYWGPVGTEYWTGISYWPGVYFSISFGNWSYFDWHRHYIHIDVHKRPRFVRHDRWNVKSDHWIHAPSHRHGVVYHNRATAAKFGRAHRGSSSHRYSHGVRNQQLASHQEANRRSIQRSTAVFRNQQDQERRKFTAESRVRESDNRVVQKRADHKKPGRLTNDPSRVVRNQQKQSRDKSDLRTRNRQTATPYQQVSERSRHKVQQGVNTGSKQQVRQVVKRVDRSQQQDTNLEREKQTRQKVKPVQQIRVRRNSDQRNQVVLKQTRQRQQLVERGSSTRKSAREYQRGDNGKHERAAVERSRSGRSDQRGENRGKNRHNNRDREDQEG